MFVIQNRSFGDYVVSRNGEIGKFGSVYRGESGGVGLHAPESSVFLILAIY
jgi:hypothetical protein